MTIQPAAPPVARSRALAALTMALCLVVAACGGNKSTPGASGVTGAAASGGGFGGAAASVAASSPAAGSSGGVAGVVGSPAASAGTSSATSGAAGSGTKGNTGQPIGSGPATGNLMIWAMGTEGDKLGQLAKDFEAKNPGVHVTVTAIGWDVAHDKFLTAIAANQTPDAAMVGTTWMGEFAKAGALDAVPSNVDVSDFFPGAWQTAVVGGTAYGVPWYVETRVLYYRTDIASKAGVSGAPATWDDLTADAKAMQSRGGAQWGMSIQPGQAGAWQVYIPLLWSNGGDILDSSGNFALDSQQAVEALTYWQSFFKDGLAPKTQAQGFDITPAFVRGQFPMFISGPWHIGLLKTAGGASFDSKWSLAPLPKKVTSTSFVGGSDFAVFKNTKNRDAAWKFVQFLSDPATQAKWYGMVADLPAVQSAWKSGTLASDKQLALFGQVLQTAKAPPSLPHWEEIAAAIDDELGRVASGEDPATAAKNMQQKATSIGNQ